MCGSGSRLCLRFVFWIHNLDGRFIQSLSPLLSSTVRRIFFSRWLRAGVIVFISIGISIKFGFRRESFFPPEPYHRRSAAAKEEESATGAFDVVVAINRCRWLGNYSHHLADKTNAPGQQYSLMTARFACIPERTLDQPFRLSLSLSV